MKVGFDFGSTYSTVSACKGNRVEALTLMEGEPASIPSVVSISKSQKYVTCGKAAKDQVGKKTVEIYEAFKMLLTEPDENVLSSRGYDKDNTPRYIARCFLNSTLQAILNRYDVDGEGLEEVCICVPEIWSKQVKTLDGRAILRTILKEELDFPVGNVRVVNEPEAASAFFAYNYEKTTQRQFNGHLLLIDYGGGTLDITLTKVFPNQNGAMEICKEVSDGEGENHPNSQGECTIGKAGIAYMQALVVQALRDCNLLGQNETPNYTSPEFLSAVRDLENQLKTAGRIQDIENVFGEYDSYQTMAEILQDGPTKPLLTLEYHDEEVPVYHQQLYSVYRDTIEGAVAEVIGRINKKVKRFIGADPCKADSGAQDSFKIALVGGFGSFYLVKKQIADIYHLYANENDDPRTQNIAADRRELAISLGAALLAEGKVVLQKTAPYSIGIRSYQYDKEKRQTFEKILYGIKCNQIVEPGKPYYLCDDNGTTGQPGTPAAYSNLRNNIHTFVVEFPGYDDKVERDMVLKPAMLDKLADIPVQRLWDCGFSMDESEIITFHVVPHNNVPGETYKIELDNFDHLFELTSF